MSESNAKVACQQCNENFCRADVKETYDEQLEICGFICNTCCIKTAESARRCQISDCKTKPDSGPTGFRTLPSKFYDLPEGEVKRRIIKQFGIFRNVRACCNMCYVRISKSVVQTKIVYGDGFPRLSKSSPSKASKHVLQSTVEKTAQSRDDRLAEYTGPKFTRRSGSALFWDRAKTQDSVTISNANESITGQGNDSNLSEKNASSNTSQCKEPDLATPIAKTHESVDDTDIYHTDKLDNNKGSDASDAKGNRITEVSYSSTPISPTSMRFRRIQPKVSRYDEFDLSSDDLGDNAELESPTRGRKRSRVNDDETWSPGKTKRDKTDGKGVCLKRSTSLNSNIMSDFVSCTGCRKICSSRETQPVFDEKKHINGRLCQDCSSKANEGKFTCPITGCSSHTDAINVVQIIVDFKQMAGGTLRSLSEMGVEKDTKTCCKGCWKKIDEIITRNDKDKGKKESTSDEQIFTMCRNCCKIVPMKNTYPNIEENGRKCGVLCQPCAGAQENAYDIDGRRGEKVPKKLKGCEQNTKSIGFCTAKGCVHAGEKQPVQLVSGKKILKNYLDENRLRAEFDLADDMDYCCRSCHARIKWFVADVRKKEFGIGADSKNSLKNLTPKSKQDNENTRGREGSFLTENCEVKKGPEIKIENGSSGHDKNEFPSETHVPSPGMSSPAEIAKIDKGIKSNCLLDTKDTVDNCNEKLIIPATRSETLSAKSTAGFQSQLLSSNFSSKSALIIPPASTTTVAGHPPVLQVGGQQFVLNVISRCEKECQTDGNNTVQKNDLGCAEKGVQANIPLMPKFEGTAPANLPNGKKVKYADAKEKTKYAVKRAGKELLDQFLQQLDDISGGCAQQLLSDIYRSKEVVMAMNYEKILSSIGQLYQNTDKSNRQERLRLLSTVALHASNDTLKRFFQRSSKKGDLISVNEAEIVQAREYAKQFGPGTHVMPIGQVSWKNFALAGRAEPTTKRNENETGQSVGEHVEEESMDEESSRTKGISIEKGSSATKDRDLSSDIPLFKKEDEKKLITLETMRKSERRQGDSGTEQLVTFKVTVRQAKEKTTNDGNVIVNATEESEDGLDAYDDSGGPPGKDHPSNGHDAVTNRDEIKEKFDNVLSKRVHRKSTGTLDSGKSMIGNHTRKLKRKSSDSQPKEKSRAKSDGGRGDITGNMQEKRKRTAFNNERKNILEQHFEKNIYASKTVVEEISKELGIDKKKIDNWFRNRRSKLKKDEEERSKRNVQLKTRKGGKKIEKEKGSADRSNGTSFADETAEMVEHVTNDRNSDGESERTNCDEKKEKGGKDKLKDDTGKEGTSVESKHGENDFTSEDKGYDEFKCKGNQDKKAADEIINERNDLNNGIRDGNLVKSNFCTEVKNLKLMATETGGNIMDFENDSLHSKNEREWNNRLESNELKKDCSKDVLNELDKASENNGSGWGKYKHGHKEDKWKRGIGLPEERTIRKVTDVQDEISELKPVSERAARTTEITDDKGDELSQTQKVRKTVIQEGNLAIEECNKQDSELPRVSCKITSKNGENQDEISVKSQTPVHVADASSSSICEESENGRKMSMKCENELDVQICDRGSDKNDGIIDKSWPSISRGPTLSLAANDDYENENVETSVRDDLAIALHSDPEFMKDFSELMNIAKTC